MGAGAIEPETETMGGPCPELPALAAAAAAAAAAYCAFWPAFWDEVIRDRSG